MLAAAVRPAPLAVLAVTVVAVLHLGWWAAVAGLTVFALVVAATLNEAGRALPAPAPNRSLPALAGVGDRLRRPALTALAAERALANDLAALPAAPAGLEQQIERLRTELVDAVERAADLERYLAGVDVGALRERERHCRLASAAGRPGAERSADLLAEQIQTVEELAARRDALVVELDHVEAALGTMRARVAHARTHAAAPAGLTREVVELRERVGALAAGITEAYGHNDGP